VLTIIQDIYQVEISIQELSEIISNQKLGDPKIVTQEIYLYLQQINERLAVLEAELSDEPNSSFQTVSQWRSHVKASQQIITILPDLLAYDDKKTLLVILQDNQELRPTGGFIESVAEITVEKGHILDFQVNDIYSLDAQLKGSVEPPPAIKDYLGEDNWWLRDANLSPDFPSTASRIAWFYQKETGKLVDGVIAINTAGFKTLLTNQNELYLTDFDEYVNATNLGEHAHSHAEVNFFGQDGKDHNFSGALAKEYYQKTISLKGRELTQFALNLYQALEENQISIWLPETDSFSIIGQTGWDGSLRKPPTQLAEFGNIDVSDYLQIVEANFGVNKVNYEIKRSLEHEIIINEKGEVSVISTLQIDNLSRTEAWPGGRYKNFLRFYLPANTRLQKVLTRSGSDLQSQVNISGDEITKTVEQDKQVFGFLTEVIPGQSQAISIYYTLKDTIPIANSTSTYALYLQKQSGIESLPLTLTLRYPSHLNLTKITQSADFSSGSLVLKRDLKKDTVFAISFSP
jgi:hypothetical protein